LQIILTNFDIDIDDSLFSVLPEQSLKHASDALSLLVLLVIVEVLLKALRVA